MDSSRSSRSECAHDLVQARKGQQRLPCLEPGTARLPYARSNPRRGIEQSQRRGTALSGRRDRGVAPSRAAHWASSEPRPASCLDCARCVGRPVQLRLWSRRCAVRNSCDASRAPSNSRTQWLCVHAAVGEPRNFQTSRFEEAGCAANPQRRHPDRDIERDFEGRRAQVAQQVRLTSAPRRRRWWCGRWVSGTARCRATCRTGTAPVCPARAGWRGAPARQTRRRTRALRT